MKRVDDRGGRGRILGLPMLVIGVVGRLVLVGGKWFVVLEWFGVSRCWNWGWARGGEVKLNREGRK
jgi:hypothetical protein